MNTFFPAYLWLGPETQLIEKVYSFLHDALCLSAKNQTCCNCKKIKQKQHHNVIWLSSNKPYTTADLEPIFERLLLTCDNNEHCFFIIEQAHFLSDTCANSLLKSLEEPARGYHFILLTQQPEFVLPTIKSRCIITLVQSTGNQLTQHSLFTFFTHSVADPLSFTKALAQTSISETEYLIFLQQLLAHWTVQLKTSIQEKQNRLAHQKLSLIQRALEKPPMPGGAKIALKNLFLLFHQTQR